MKRAKITVVIAYDENNIVATRFVNTFKSLDLSESNTEIDEDGYVIESAMVEEL